MTLAPYLKVLDDSLDPAILEDLDQFVQDVEAKLKSEIASQVELVDRSLSQTLNGGGKRIRPSLVYLSALATQNEFDYQRCVNVGAAMEMIHMATLIHDDVIDHAETRRGVPTANHICGNTASVLSGDVLLSKSMSLLAQDGDVWIIREVADVVVEMAEGEVQELEFRGKINLSVEDHYSVLHKKTATFIACCCKAGARIAGSDQASMSSLELFGNEIGLAFQVIDDILDFQGDTDKLGKQTATDFREGCATLPLLELWPSLNEQEKEFVSCKFGNGVSQDDLNHVLNLMNERGALEKAKQRATDHIQKAKDSLARLPSSTAKDLMVSLAGFVESRKS